MEHTAGAVVGATRRVRGEADGRVPAVVVAAVLLLVLAGLGIEARGTGPFVSADAFAGLLGAVAHGLPGAVIATRQPRNAVGWLLLAIGLVHAVATFSGAYGATALAGGSAALPGAEWMRWLGLWIWSVAWGLVPAVLLLVVPDGRLLGPRWRPVLAAAVAGVSLAAVGWAVTPYDARDAVVVGAGPNPFASDVGPVLLVVAVPLLAVGAVGGLASLVLRYRRASGAARDQASWVVLGALATVVLLVVAAVLPFEGVGRLVGTLAIVPLPAGTMIAALRHGLWDVDAALSRSLLYAGTTTVLVVGWLVVVVVVGGVLGRASGAPVVAVALVALVAQPLHERLRRQANRLVYGQRDEPVELLGRLADRLRGGPDALGVATGVLREALRVPYVAVEHDDQRIEDGTPTGDLRRIPLVHEDRCVGHLVLPDAFTRPGDERLLAGITPQLAGAVNAVRLAADLARARERTVLASEDERRRLRRELHDGLGPTLAAIALGIEAAQGRVDADAPDVAGIDRDLTRLAAHLNEAVAEVRRLVEGLRPVDLDLGLAAAVDHVVERLDAPACRVRRVGGEELGALPAATELAALRIASEAIANAVRHAGASNVDVVLARAGGALVVEVVDDGGGIAADAVAGVGMASMRERAGEVGGRLDVVASDAGTSVVGVLPLRGDPPAQGSADVVLRPLASEVPS